MDKYENRRLALKRLIDTQYDGVVSDFAKAVDMDASYVSRMLYIEGKAGKKRIGEVSIEKIDHLHPGWLDTNHKTTHQLRGYSSHRVDGSAGNVGEKIPLGGRVPIISMVAAGNWSEAVDNLSPGVADEWIETTIPVKRHTYALKVSGDSMEPKFPDGAIIIVEPEEEARNGSYVIVRQNGAEATFKQLVYDGAQAYLKPLNNRYPIMPLLPDAAICGVVKQMVMDV